MKIFYTQKREKMYRAGKLPRLIRFRKLIHPIVINSARIESLLCGRKVTVVNDSRSTRKGTFVYACSHIDWDDIQMAFESMKAHAWLFWGNPEYRAMHYYVLLANGAVCVDLYSKTDRKIAKETAIKMLQKGESLLIFPEGAWNIMTNLPVMKLFPGAADIAISAGVGIVPIGISQNGSNEYYISFGEIIPTDNFSIDSRNELTQLLRDHIASEVWKTWEAQPQQRRQDFPPDAERSFYQFLESKMHGVYSIEDIENERYHDRLAISPKEAFYHLNNLIPCRDNAFLFNKRLFPARNSEEVPVWERQN